ncbi:MAG: hypothetical protein RL095_3040 [Verrucomicrobiota bacterium]|jgi:hypothetical protein
MKYLPSFLALLVLASCGEKADTPAIPPAEPTKPTKAVDPVVPLPKQEVATVKPKAQETPPAPPAAPARHPLYTLEKAQECDNLYQLKLHEALDPKCLDSNLEGLVRVCLGDHSVDVYSYLAEKYSGRPEFNQQLKTICALKYRALDTSKFDEEDKFFKKNIRYSKDKSIAYFVYKYNKYKIKTNPNSMPDYANVFFNILRKRNKAYDDNDLLLVKFLMSKGHQFNTFQFSDDRNNPKLKTWSGGLTPLDVAMAYETEGTAMQDLLREYGARTMRELLDDPRTPRESPIENQESYRLQNKVCIPYTYEQKPDPKAVAKYAAEVQAWVDYYEKGGFAKDRAAREEAAKAEYDFLVSKGMKTVAPGTLNK